jgi:hypothetical protein
MAFDFPDVPTEGQVYAPSGGPIYKFTAGKWYAKVNEGGVAPTPDPPVITSSNAVSIPENQALAHTLTANETVAWAKAGGADAALFSLTGAALSLTAKDYEAPVDADANNTYVVQIQATSTASGLVTNQTLTVTVTNVSEDVTPPNITSSPTWSQPENTDLTITLTADEAVTWSKVGGADQGQFSLTGNSLVLTGKDFELPSDTDGNNVYVVTIRATDPSNNYTNQTISVTITDVAEAIAYKDSFNRGDAALDNSLAASGGWNWTFVGDAGKGAIQSNMLAAFGASGEAFFEKDVGQPNMYAQCRVKNLNSPGSFLMVRETTPNPQRGYIGLRANGLNLQLYRKDQGVVYTQILDTNFATALDDIIRMNAVDQYIDILKNGIVLVAGIGVGGTGPMFNTATRAGLHIRQSDQNPWVDDFECGPLTTDPALFIDTFTRGNAALKDSPVADQGGSWTWDGISNDLTIAANDLTSFTSSKYGSAYKTPDRGSTDHWVEWTVGNNTADKKTCFFACRLVDNNNFIGVRHGTDEVGDPGVTVFSVVGGAYNVVGFDGTERAVGSVIRLTVTGTTYNVKTNGVVSYSSGSVPAATTLNSQKCGIVTGFNTSAGGTVVAAAQRFAAGKV